MKIALIVVAAVVVLIVAVVAIGAALPKQHSASRSMIVKSSPDVVYGMVRDFASHARWRPDVQKIDILSASQFREHASHGVVTYSIDDDQPGRRLVTRIVDKDLGYSGSWTYLFEGVPEGTRVTITENGEVSNVVFRFMSRFVFGHATTMEKYLAALQRASG